MEGEGHGVDKGEQDVPAHHRDPRKHAHAATTVGDSKHRRGVGSSSFARLAVIRRCSLFVCKMDVIKGSLHFN